MPSLQATHLLHPRSHLLTRFFTYVFLSRVRRAGLQVSEGGENIFNHAQSKANLCIENYFQKQA